MEILKFIWDEATYFCKKIGIIKTDDDRVWENLYLNNHAKSIEDEEQLLNFVKGMDNFVPGRAKCKKILFKLSADYFVEFKFLIKQFKRKYKRRVIWKEWKSWNKLKQVCLNI